MKKVLKIVPSDFTNESRDLREILTLCQHDYHVTVYAMHNEGIPEFEDKEFQIHRFILTPAGAKGTMNKLLGYMSFALQCVKNGRRFAPDFISAHDLPALMIGYLIKITSKRPCKLIYDSHELTSEMASNRHQSKCIVAMKKNAEKIFIHKADRVMVVSESIADYNHKQFGLKERPWVIKNIPQRHVNNKRYDHFRESFDIKQSDRILLYQGVIRQGRGVNILIDALKYLDEHIVVVLMGYGEVEEVLQYAKDNHAGHRVFYKEAVPYHQLLEYSSSADIGICLIENYCLSYYFCLPASLFLLWIFSSLK